MIADLLSNKILLPIVTELHIRGKLNISLVFIKQCYFSVSKNLRLNSTHYCIMKFANKREIQLITINHSPGIDLKDLTNLYKRCPAKLSFFLVKVVIR